MKLLLLGILVLLLLLSVCLFAMVQYRKNLDKQMNHILEILDSPGRPEDFGCF